LVLAPSADESDTVTLIEKYLLFLAKVFHWGERTVLLLG
jgi:hypothetical protein